MVRQAETLDAAPRHAAAVSLHTVDPVCLEARDGNRT